MKQPYLAKRGRVYQFSRRVPDEVREIIGRKYWRETLDTDSETEAIIRCRRRASETDEDIRRAKDGTFRHYSDDEIDDLARRWSIEFQEAHSATIAHEMFPHHFPQGEPVSDDETPKIFSSRKVLEQAVTDWALGIDEAPEPGTADWEKLIDDCLDEYLVANPEISNDWQHILAEQGIRLGSQNRAYNQVVSRPPRVPARNKLTNIFQEFLDSGHGLTEGTIDEYQLSVDRFVSFHGDLDVTKITRTHVEQYRDGLRQLPSRPPNAIREMPIRKQIEWAEGRDLKRIEQGAINKNFLGVKAALNYAFLETSVFSNRDWRSPFEGFAKKPKDPKNPIIPFTNDQLRLVFSPSVFTMKTKEKFWIPLILMFTGARLDEISQLHVEDIKMHPVPHILSENLEDEDPAIAKKLKTESSHRTIPIHSKLIELGFLDYVSAIAKTGNVHLFPDLPHGKGRGRGDLVSRDFINKFRTYGADHPDTGLNTYSLVTHSLRHKFRNLALYLPDQMFVEITMGHYVPGTSIQNYGKQAYLMPDLLAMKVIDHMSFPELDAGFLSKQARYFLGLIGK